MSIVRDAFAIVGLGVTRQGRVPEMSCRDMKVEGVRLAIEDAGLKAKDIDGWVYQSGLTDMNEYCAGGVVPKILGFDAKFMWNIQAGGSSAIGAVTAACAALDAGLANYVAIGYGDSALSSSLLVGAGVAERDTPGAFGMYSPGACHALAARRHMHVYGTTKEQLGAVALAAREYANLRPDAYLHSKPLTMSDYLGARPIAEPLGKYDYCLTADGGCGLIITTAERARRLTQNPVYISGIGFGHSVGTGYARMQYEELGIGSAKESALRMSGLSIGEIDVAQIYDCFSITVLLTLEGWGFCKKGEGGPFVADGNTRLSGCLPTNTAGGEMSWSYMQGFTPLVEGVRQMRGQSGTTQVADAEFCLVTGHGGTTPDGIGQMEYGEAGMILRRA
ncbi:MAG: thiolase family protein [Georgfuchsia sp.]